jgi:hypothetical protein
LPLREEAVLQCRRASVGRVQRREGDRRKKAQQSRIEAQKVSLSLSSRRATAHGAAVGAALAA